MRVALIVRPTVFSGPGGDTKQFEMTAYYLRKLGVTIDIKKSDEPIEINSYEILHFTGMLPWNILPHLHSNKPYVFTPLFVDYIEYERNHRKGILGILFRLLSRDQIEYLKALGRWILQGERIKSLRYLLLGHRNAVKYIIANADCLLPSSEHEYQRVATAYKLRPPYKAIVNAVDTKSYSNPIVPNNLYRDYIICAARIEGLKNQLNLIRALNNTSYRLAIIGKPAPNHTSYYELCKKAAAPNVVFVNHLEQADLYKIYAAARVHVLPSYFETTGLASLEAAVMGCNVVITNRGDTEEYFEDLAWYCEPDDPASILKAVELAYHSPFQDKLRKKIISQYTWEHAASQVLEVYKNIKPL